VGLSPRIIDVIHAGTELDAVNRIVSPEQLIVSLDKMIAEARGFLRETEASDPQLEKWIDQIFET
jgi:hypothetical protein